MLDEKYVYLTADQDIGHCQISLTKTETVMPPKLTAALDLAKLLQGFCAASGFQAANLKWT